MPSPLPPRYNIALVHRRLIRAPDGRTSVTPRAWRAASLLAALGIDQHHEYVTPTGRPIRYSDGKVVKELLAS